MSYFVESNPLHHIAVERASHFVDWYKAEHTFSEQLERAIGTELAKWTCWNGMSILRIAAEALEDANYHTMACVLFDLVEMDDPGKRDKVAEQLALITAKPDSYVVEPTKKARPKAKQATFASMDVEAMPLFSGTPMSVEAKTSHQPSAGTKQMGFARCRACMDTGRVSDKFCTCVAGQAARARASRPVAAPTSRTQALEW